MAEAADSKEILGPGKCTKQPALNADKNAKSHLNQRKENPFSAEPVTLKENLDSKV